MLARAEISVNPTPSIDRDGPLQREPFVLYWNDSRLPVRTVRAPGRSAPLGADAPPWIVSGPVDRPFDFCGHMRRLCTDITHRCAELRHIDLKRLLICVTQARSGQAHGLQARVTPLRFRGGALIRQRGRSVYRVQRYVVGGREILYQMAFCLPRFLDQEFDDKFVTLFHELFHVGPAFDGDLRRHGGRYDVHTHSQKEYDRHMAGLAREYVASGADPALYAFLRLNFAQLRRRHGSVVGIVLPRPKVIPEPRPVSGAAHRPHGLTKVVSESVSHQRE
jgi:hypothetical protein